MREVISETTTLSSDVHLPMYITAQGCRLRNDLYCVEWDVKLAEIAKFRGVLDTLLDLTKF